MKKNKIAVAIFSFNRPGYLAEVLKSLEKNSCIDDIDFYFFQDGTMNKFSKKLYANLLDINKCINLWNKSKLPNKTLIKNQYNLGIGISQFNVKSLLFDKLRYEKVIFFEDDMIVSKNYIRLIRIMLDQFGDDPNVGAVMCHGLEDPPISKKEKLWFLYSLKTGNPQLWGWATWLNRWEKIKSDFLEYYKFIEEIDYKERSENKILDFYKKERFNVKATSQDAAIYYSFFKNNLIVLNTKINRSKYIGEKGEHMTSDIFKKELFDKTILDEFEEDETVEKFEDYDKKEFMRITRSIFQL